MAFSFSPDPAIEAVVARVWAAFPPLQPTGLARVEDFLAALGDPHLSLPPVFHAAGTNGKGSTLAFIRAILEAGGKTVHAFTSPHLVGFEERIVVAGRNIDAALLEQLAAECTQAARGRDVSFFEFFTALAFLAFSRVPADAVLLETGLGGLLDSTNVVKSSVAVLTRISFDHTQILGDTLEKIARQKAGIIKPGCPAVSAPQPGEGVMAVFRAAGGEWLFAEWSVRDAEDGFIYESPQHRFTLPRPALAGAHQIVNAGTAIAAVEKSAFAGLLRQDVLERAMRAVAWEGRLQKIDSALVPQGWELWLDGAHNDSGAEVLAAQMRQWNDAPVCLIAAMKQKKDAGAFFRLLAPHVSSAVALKAEMGADVDLGIPMVAAEELREEMQSAGILTEIAENLESAIAAASQGSTRGRILVTGSLYLVGHVLRVMGK
jgi:dihydrofolate synthase / folylpolyglutamate synthase